VRFKVFSSQYLAYTVNNSSTMYLCQLHGL
jgi:hypothetical protein